MVGIGGHCQFGYQFDDIFGADFRCFTVLEAQAEQTRRGMFS
jgi:hypothetical protein